MTTHDTAVAPSDLEKTLPLPKLGAARLFALALYYPTRGWWHRTGSGTKILIGLLITTIAVISLRDADAATSHSASPGTTRGTAAAATTSPPPTGTPVEEDPAATPPQRPNIEQRHQLPLALVGSPLPAAPMDPAPRADPGPTVLHPTTEVVVYAEPGGTAVARLPERQIIAPTYVPVIARQPGWALVLLPGEPGPDGVAPAGWIHLEPAIELSEIGHRIEINHTTATVSVLAEVGRATTATTSTLSAATTASTPRTFVAIGAGTAAVHWPLALIWPFTITGDKLCTRPFGGVSVPGLPANSPVGQRDATGCVTAPTSLHRALADVPSGAPVITR